MATRPGDLIIHHFSPRERRVVARAGGRIPRPRTSRTGVSVAFQRKSSGRNEAPAHIRSPENGRFGAAAGWSTPLTQRVPSRNGTRCVRMVTPPDGLRQKRRLIRLRAPPTFHLVGGSGTSEGDQTKFNRLN